jgi:hypothetical protein
MSEWHLSMSFVVFACIPAGVHGSAAAIVAETFAACTAIQRPPPPAAAQAGPGVDQCDELQFQQEQRGGGDCGSGPESELQATGGGCDLFATGIAASSEKIEEQVPTGDSEATLPGVPGGRMACGGTFKHGLEGVNEEQVPGDDAEVAYRGISRGSVACGGEFKLEHDTPPAGRCDVEVGAQEGCGLPHAAAKGPGKSAKQVSSDSEQSLFGEGGGRGHGYVRQGQGQVGDQEEGQDVGAGRHDDREGQDVCEGRVERPSAPVGEAGISGAGGQASATKATKTAAVVGARQGRSNTGGWHDRGGRRTSGPAEGSRSSDGADAQGERALKLAAAGVLDVSSGRAAITSKGSRNSDGADAQGERTLSSGRPANTSGAVGAGAQGERKLKSAAAGVLDVSSGRTAHTNEGSRSSAGAQGERTLGIAAVGVLDVCSGRAANTSGDSRSSDGADAQGKRTFKFAAAGVLDMSSGRAAHSSEGSRSSEGTELATIGVLDVSSGRGEFDEGSEHFYIGDAVVAAVAAEADSAAGNTASFEKASSSSGSGLGTGHTQKDKGLVALADLYMQLQAAVAAQDAEATGLVINALYEAEVNRRRQE